MKIINKVAIITGVGRGIGRTLANRFAEEGAKVIIAQRSMETGEQVADEIAGKGGEACFIQTDISMESSTISMAEKTIEKYGSIDILINNATVSLASLGPKPFDQISVEEWDRVMTVNLRGTWLCCKAVSPSMKDQKSGKIINTSSSAWDMGSIPFLHYLTSKAGIVGLTRAVAREMGRYGVTCNAYAPTAATRFTIADDIVAGFKKRYEAGLMTKERFEELTNLPDPEIITPFLVYLCTDAAADINGQVFDVTGGNIALYSEPVKIKSILKEEGLWTVEELIDLVPKVLLEGYKNPAPAEPAK